MKRTEAVDVAIDMTDRGQTAYICDNDGLVVSKKPSGHIILVLRPERILPRSTLVTLLAHRMRMLSTTK